MLFSWEARLSFQIQISMYVVEKCFTADSIEKSKTKWVLRWRSVIGHSHTSTGHKVKLYVRPHGRFLASYSAPISPLFSTMASILLENLGPGFKGKWLVGSDTLVGSCMRSWMETCGICQRVWVCSVFARQLPALCLRHPLRNTL